MADSAERHAVERYGCVPTFAALLGASLFATLSVTIGLWTGFAWIFFWLIWLVTLGVAVLVGLPLYFSASALGRVNAGTAAGAGMVAGAIIPMLSLLFAVTAPSKETIAGIAAFGACGAAAGSIFLLILRWSRLSKSSRARFSAVIAAISALAFCGAWTAQDHSCHSPVWYGQGIAPSASFSIKLPSQEWHAIAAQIDSFAGQNGWSVRTSAAYTPNRRWFEMSVCRADGTDIVITKYNNGAPFEAFAYQPQGGDGWKPPLRDLQARMRARWPEAIEYRDSLGQPTNHAPAWAGNLPLPTPAPSSASH